MAEEDRERYSGRVCEECGLPLNACTDMALLRAFGKRMRRTIKAIADGSDADARSKAKQALVDIEREDADILQMIEPVTP